LTNPQQLPKIVKIDLLSHDGKDEDAPSPQKESSDKDAIKPSLTIDFKKEVENQKPEVHDE